MDQLAVAAAAGGAKEGISAVADSVVAIAQEPIDVALAE